MRRVIETTSSGTEPFMEDVPAPGATQSEAQEDAGIEDLEALLKRARQLQQDSELTATRLESALAASAGGASSIASQQLTDLIASQQRLQAASNKAALHKDMVRCASSASLRSLDFHDEVSIVILHKLVNQLSPVTVRPFMIEFRLANI